MNNEKTYERINTLSADPLLGCQPYEVAGNKMSFGNCHGLVLDVKGCSRHDRPIAVSPKNMESLLSSVYFKKTHKSPFVIAAFKKNNVLVHSGLVISNNILFHQIDSAQQYQFSTVTTELLKRPNAHVEYYSLVKDFELPISDNEVSKKEFDMLIRGVELYSS